MSEVHDVLHTLIDVAAGAHARLSPHEATLLHEGVDRALADATALDGPDAAPEPSGDPAPAESPYQPPYPPAAPGSSTPGSPVQPGVFTNSGDPVAG